MARTPQIHKEYSSYTIYGGRTTSLPAAELVEQGNARCTTSANEKQMQKMSEIYNLSVSLMTNLVNMEGCVWEGKGTGVSLYSVRTHSSGQAQIRFWQYSYMTGLQKHPVNNMWG